MANAARQNREANCRYGSRSHGSAPASDVTRVNYLADPVQGSASGHKLAQRVAELVPAILKQPPKNACHARTCDI